MCAVEPGAPVIFNLTARKILFHLFERKHRRPPPNDKLSYGLRQTNSLAQLALTPKDYVESVDERNSHRRGRIPRPVGPVGRERWSEETAVDSVWGRAWLDKGMIDRKIMRSLLESMERAAEETLQQDPAFYAAVQALKLEIDTDPLVQAMVDELRAAGRSVFNSFVPHVKIRVRTEEGVFALPRPAGVRAAPAVEQIGRLTQELRNAASAAIKKSRYYNQLDSIVNEAIESSDRFEGIASEVESAGHEVIICLDFSAYAQVQASPLQRELPRGNPQMRGESPAPIQLTAGDRKFLTALKIRIDPS